MEISRRQLLALLSAAPALGKPAQDPFVITDNVNLVLLDVSVMKRGGGYVTGLQRDQFKVFDSGRLARISQFASVDSPVTVGLIVDDSGSMRPKRPAVILAGLAFAKESNPQDEFFVVNFNDRVVAGLPAGVPFTDNIQQLHQALYMGNPQGKTALYDAIAYGLQHLERGHRDKRTLIVVSDGGDNASHVSLADTLALIEESRATVYTIGLLDPDSSDLNPAVLRRFASISGGEYFEPQKTDEIISVLGQISKDIRNRYTLGFTPEPTKDQRTVHAIKVTASQDGRKLMVRTRTSYSIAPSSAGAETQ